MTPQQQAAMRQALEALESTGLFLHHCWCDVQMNDYSFEKLNKQMEIVDSTLTALRRAIQSGTDVEQQPADEPVGQPIETIRYWLDAYSNPKGDKHFMGHGMVVTLLREYLALRENTRPQPAATNEADELLRYLGLDPQTYRTDGGAINRMKVKAALAHPDEYPRTDSMDAMVGRFLAWKLPQDFYPDSFISFDREKHDAWGGYPNSWPTGTNLLNSQQAKAMLEHVVGTQPSAPAIPEGWKLVPVDALTRWRNAFAEELGAWDIDPPLHHVKTSHDEIDAMLAAAPEQPANNFFKQFETGNMRMPAAQWVGLTFDMIEGCFPSNGGTDEYGQIVLPSVQWLHDFAHTIEAKLREKNVA